MIDPRNNAWLWMLMRCTGGTDAWTDPLEDRDQARCDRIVAWLTAGGALMVVLAIAGAVATEVVRTWV